MAHLMPPRLLTPRGVLLLLILSGVACQPLSTATKQDVAEAAASPQSGNTVNTYVVRLPATPPSEALTIAVGQHLLLPMRTPAERWQIDYDPRFWQRLDHSDQIELIALTSGATEVVQREHSPSGGPAPRRFVYQLDISR